MTMPAGISRVPYRPIHSRLVLIIWIYIIDGSQVAMPGNRDMKTTASTVLRQVHTELGKHLGLRSLRRTARARAKNDPKTGSEKTRKRGVLGVVGRRGRFYIS